MKGENNKIFYFFPLKIHNSQKFLYIWIQNEQSILIYGLTN